MQIWGKLPLSRLSARERQWYVLFLHGHSMKEIAAQMGVSLSAASHVRARLMKKLLVNTDVTLVLLGLRNGLIDEDAQPAREDGNLLPLTTEELTR